MLLSTQIIQRILHYPDSELYLQPLIPLRNNSSPQSPTMKAKIRVPGTCGEFVQGMLDGRHFLVSCPIDLYSTVSVDLLAEGPSIHCPPERPKAWRAARH